MSKEPKKYEDLFGNELAHGDRVITIKLNYRARGGDLAVAFVKDFNGVLGLVHDMDDTHPAYSFYTIIKSDKVVKL